jgi:hypothetical protein
MKRKVILRPLLLTFIFIMTLSFAAMPQPTLATEMPPDAPGNFEVTGSVTNVILRWEDNSDNELGFLIERQDPGGAWDKIGETTPDVNVYSDTVSVPGTYLYRVSAWNNAGASDYSNKAGYTYSKNKTGSLPVNPSNLTASVWGPDVLLRWTYSSEDVTGFIVEKKPPGGNWNEIADTNRNVLSYTDKVSNTGTYYYRVRAMNNSGTSEPSNEASAMVQSLTFTGITISLQVNDPYMTVNNVIKELDPGRGTVPVIIEDRILLPIRAIVEALGGIIAWDETSREVTIKDSGATIELWVGNTITYVNGVKKITDVAPQIINDRTMLPIRFVVENLGATINWENQNRIVTIRR